MRLDENWTLEPDAHCWVLEYIKKGGINPKTGKPKITSKVMYPVNMKHGLMLYLDEALKPSTEVQDVLNRISEVESLIENIECKEKK